MADLDRIVNVQISRQTAVPSVESYQDVMVVAEFLAASVTPAMGTEDRILEVGDMDEVVDYGFGEASFVYKACEAIFSQSPRLPRAFIGRKLTGADGTETWTEALGAIKDANNEWYGLIVSTRTGSDQQAVADWVEANKKLCMLASSDAAMLTNAGGSIGDYLKTNNLDRTSAWYHPDATNEIIDAAVIGKMFPKNPGSVNWAHKTLAGIAVYSLTSAQITQLEAKNANYYTSISGNAVTQFGKVGSGEWIDVIHGIDWLVSQIQKAVYTPILQRDKVPFNDSGIGAIDEQLRYALSLGVTNTIINEGFTTSVPLGASVDIAKKKARTLPDVKFNAVLSGAINKTEIQGTVTL